MNDNEEGEDMQDASKERQEKAGVQEESSEDEEFRDSESQECHPVDESQDDEDAEEEAEAQRPLRDPGMPTKAEIAEHGITHMPPRPWCPHCVRGKGRDSPSLTVAGRFAENPDGRK